MAQRVKDGGGGEPIFRTSHLGYREDEGERSSSGRSSRRGSGSSSGSGGSSGSRGGGGGRSPEKTKSKDANIYGEVDCTDGEMGSVSSSSPLSMDSDVGENNRAGRGAAGSSSTGSSSRADGRDENVGSPAASRSSKSSGAPAINAGGGGSRGNTGGGDSTDTAAAQAIPGVTARPAAVPFGASALSKTMPNNGRGRPRGLRPRSSAGGGAEKPGKGGSSQRVASFSASMPRPAAAAATAGVGGNILSRRAPSAKFMESEVRAAEIAAPGVPVDVVVRAAIRIESVMRVLIARGHVRRKLVSEVTAFSLIMERGIEVIKHPYSGNGKPKNVTVNFVSRKGHMQLSWGGKSGVPLETIFGVTKGLSTDALRSAVDPERADNCFSVHTQERTIDFEVDNPWLVLLVVRALRLFLGAHYDTLPAPTFFSHLCVRPRDRSGGGRADSSKQTLVWTSGDQSPSGKGQTTRSTPTERTSAADSASDGSGGGENSGRKPWDGQDAAGVDNDSDSGSVMQTMRRVPSPPRDGGGGGALPPPAPAGGNIYGDVDDDRRSSGRSPGGVMALFSTGGVPIAIPGGATPRSMTSRGQGFAATAGPAVGRGAAKSGSAAGAAGGGDVQEDAPLTASQLLATRGFTKRLNLAKKLSAANANTGPLKGKRFELMALPMDPGQQDRRGTGERAEAAPKRTQGMSISIGAGYSLPEEKQRAMGGDEGEEGGSRDSLRTAVVDDLNHKLQSLRKLCVPQTRPRSYRPERAPKTMAVKHMALFSVGSGSSKASGAGLGSVADMWGDGVRRQYQTDMVRSSNTSVEDMHKRDTARTAMLVNRSGVHRVTRKGAPS